MEIDKVEINVFTVLLYPSTAELIAEACIRSADNSDNPDFMLTIGTALKALAMAARGKDSEVALKGIQATRRGHVQNVKVPA